MKFTQVIICQICLLCLLTISVLGAEQPSAALAEKGYLDFGGRLQTLTKPVYLDGEWEFYWQQFLGPEDFSRKRAPLLTGYLNVPGYWNNKMVNGETLTGKGYATIRLIVDNILPYQILFLKIPKPKLAYRLYINGVLTNQCGIVGKTESESKLSPCLHVPAFYLAEDRLEIIFQVSNFHRFSGGFWQGLTLGDHQILESDEKKQLGLDLFIIGALLIMGVYYIGVFSLRHEESSTLYFGLFSLVMSLRTSFHNSMFFVTLFPRFEWSWFIRLDYLTFPALMATFAAFLYYLYPEELKTNVFRFLLGVAAVMTLHSLFSSTYQITRFLTLYQIIILAFCFLTIYVIVYAFINKRNGAAEMLAGCIILFITIINDMLYAQSIINTFFTDYNGLWGRTSQSRKVSTILLIYMDFIKECP